MVKWWILVCFLGCNLIRINGQTIVSGKISIYTNSPIPSASITLSDSLNGNILAYAISNAKGEYKIEITSSLKEFVLQVRAFNYATETRTIPNLSATYNFTLTPKPTELPNVLVKPPPIQKRGDTINYVVSAFADQKDRSIADVPSGINCGNENINNIWERIFGGVQKSIVSLLKKFLRRTFMPKRLATFNKLKPFTLTGRV